LREYGLIYAFLFLKWAANAKTVSAVTREKPRENTFYGANIARIVRV